MIDPYQYTIYICEYQKTWLKEIEDAKKNARGLASLEAFQ